MIVSALGWLGRVWVDSALKMSRLGPEWVQLWAGLVQFQNGALENYGVWFKGQGGIW